MDAVVVLQSQPDSEQFGLVDPAIRLSTIRLSKETVHSIETPNPETDIDPESRNNPDH